MSTAHITVALIQEHIDFADNVACVMRARAFLKDRKKKNGQSGSFDKLFWNERLGARCELAAKRWLNPIKWHALNEETGLPDLGDFVDVKGVEKRHHKMIVYEDAKDRFAFLLVDAASHTEYEIVGWLWGEEAKQREFWDDPVGGRAAYFVPRERLHRPDSLMSLIHPAK